MQIAKMTIYYLKWMTHLSNLSINTAIMWDMILNSMDGCTNYFETFKIFLIFNYLTGKTRFYIFLVIFSFFRSNFLSLCE